MRAARWGTAILGAVMGLGAAMPLGWAAADEYHPKGYLDGAARKLGRGAANVLTAPLELIRTPYFIGAQDGGFAAITAGMAQGLVAGVVRELAGIVEVATFPIPIPKDFRPLVKPEFVYAHGDWAP